MAGAVLALVLGMSSLVFAETEADEKIKRGVKIGGEDVGRMTAREAKGKIRDVVKDKNQIKVTIHVGDKSCETTLYDLGYDWANEKIVNEAVAFGKSGSLLKRYVDRNILANEGKNYDIQMKLNEKRLKKRLDEAVEPAETPMQNAKLKATGHGFKIIKESDGLEVNIDKATREFSDFVNKKWDKKSDIEFTAQTEVTKPKYTEKDCEKVSDEPMGEFGTSLTGLEEEPRNKNIKNGVKKLNGHTIYPGEEFSCNAELVPWTKENGWKPAGTYVGDKVEDSLGGGICQVSTTLYNALLRAEIEVTERSPHSMSVGYVDFGADAALAGDYQDLKFRNNTDAPIYVQGIYNGDSIKFCIYGHDTRPKYRRVEYQSELVKTIPITTEIVKDPSKPAGYVETKQEGHNGRVAKLWKIVYEHDKQVSKELLHESTYKMVPNLIIKGTGSADAGKTEEPQSEKATEAPID